jgi:biopolymer transport protein ExbD
MRTDGNIDNAAKPRRKHIAIDSFEPISAINTTPLIDVMLVLLIMMIITIPVTTHKVPIDLPGHALETTPPPVHRLVIDPGGRLSWDGTGIDDAQLRARLAILAGDPSEPDLHIAAAAEARYERVDQVLAEVKRAGITRLGFIGNQAFAEGLD